MNNVLQSYCSEGWCEYIQFHSTKINIKTDSFIFVAGEETLGIHIIITGKVKVITKTGNDTERIIRLAAEGDILGHRGFGGPWKYTVSAMALEDTELVFIPLKIFNEAVRANPEFAYFMMMFFAEELRESERLATQLPIRNIIASVLFNNLQVFGYAKDSKTKLSYTLSRKDLASQAGTRYETLVRTLADFNNEGIIKIEGKSIHVLKVNDLVDLKDGLK
jgi:CRP-like cAMP-binding protein